MAKLERNYCEKYKQFYNSTEWKSLRDYKFAQANGLCEECLKKGIISEGVDVHHIEPIESNWSRRLDYTNLILLCKDCHNQIHGRGGSLTEFLNLMDDS